MNIPTIGTPQEFEAAMDARDDHEDRREALVARIATLAPADLAALRAYCLTLGTDVAELEAEERIIGTRPAWLLGTTILGANAQTPAGDDATYIAIAERIIADISAWLDARGATTNTYGLTDGAVALVLALVAEAGEDVSGQATEDVLYGFTGNHQVADINAAAAGDVPALVALRTACGLPVFR